MCRVQCSGVFRSRRRKALIAWTAIAIAVGVLARFTFAAPEPDPCKGDESGLCINLDFRPLWYLLIALVWLLGLFVIWSIGFYLDRWRERRGRGHS